MDSVFISEGILNMYNHKNDYVSSKLYIHLLILLLMDKGAKWPAGCGRWGQGEVVKRMKGYSMTFLVIL